jgi:hypothetical protein
VDKKKKLDKGKPEPKAKEPEPAPPRPVIESLYLHVQVGNDEAKAFWEKHGFVVTVGHLLELMGFKRKRDADATVSLSLFPLRRRRCPTTTAKSQ